MSVTTRQVEHESGEIREVESSKMWTDRILWAMQWIFGLYFIAIGTMHFILPAGLPELMGWMYELDARVHYLAGTAEMLGGLGLVVPWSTRIRPALTPLAAAGLAVVMVGAALWHVSRGELTPIAGNLVMLAAMAFVAVGRWRHLRR